MESTTSQSDSALLPLIDAIRAKAQTHSHSHSSDDPIAHTNLLNDIHALLLFVETPLDTIYRYGHQHWLSACTRTALDLGLFQALVDAGDAGVEIEALAERVGADRTLLTRIVRVLVANGICDLDADGRYKANERTMIMTRTQGISSFQFWFDYALPTALALPSYLRSHNYQNPNDNTDTIFAQAFNSEFWTYLGTHPAASANFNQFMQSRRIGRGSWFEPYPVEERLFTGMEERGKDKDGAGEGGGGGVLLVDIGGGRGHDLVKFKERFPDHPGGLVLQDQAETIAEVDGQLGVGGVECIAHDFFQPQPQPMHGARAYHFRAIFHDWADEACRRILRQITAVMKPQYSKILISEYILGDGKTRGFPAALDVQMMALHAGMERSESQWRDLLAGVGLRISGIWQKIEGGEGVIEAVLADE